MTDEPRASRRAVLREAVAWIVESAFVFDMFWVGLTVAALLLGRINPLHSHTAQIVCGVTVLVVLVHAYWMRRHRDLMVNKPDRAAIKERRGY